MLNHRGHIQLFALPFLLTTLTACSPLYIAQAVYEESKILLAREEIATIVDSPELDPTEKAKLALVLEARDFAERIGLTPKESFTQYTKVDRDILAWVLLASAKDSFSLYTWWYPFVGTVPYKGYFRKESARCAADRLEAKGYETWVRGTEAISTLGWFNDPVLSTTLRHPPHRVANTVIHEIFHSTIWVPNHVDFNESVANFVGYQGAIDLFAKKLSDCTDNTCRKKTSLHLTGAREARQRELALAKFVDTLYNSLKELYQSDLRKEEKLHQREQIFNRLIAPLRERHPNLRLFKNLNNAEIMQLRLYLTQLELFEKLYTRCEKDWGCFFQAIQKTKSATEKSGSNPFVFLTTETQSPFGIRP